MIDLNRIIGIDDNQKDSKVVLASSYDDVCHDMEVDEIVDVERLSLTDSWNMFEEKVGHLISNPLIEPIAWCVVEECHGLPLLIDRVARTFRKKEKNVSLWEDGLKRLQRWDSIKIEGMDEVLERLEICYEDLKDDEQKVCFLYGALYPEESEIYVDYLLECWRAEGFINHANDFKQARNRGHTVLNELIKVSLLERSDKSKCVKMNKVLRKMVLRISSQSTNSKLLVKPNEGLEDFPRKEEWEHANRISLMDNQLSTLPETLDCRNLLTLLLQRNKYLTSIPELFFKSICRLQVLDLHGTKIAVLPSSLSNLICLKALYLNSCSDLIEIPSSVEALQHLQVLDIRKTKLNLLQIGSLIWLKCLRISLCNFDTGNHTEAQVSGFDALEELSIDFGSSEEGWDKIVDMVVKEDSFLTFQFAIGCHDSACAQILESIDNPSYNILKLVNCDGIDPVIIKVLMKTNAFGLIGHKGVTSLSNFGIEKMNRMLDCLIDGCHEIKTIVYGNETSKAVLEWLENLYISNVPKLESIWQGPVHAGSLAQLTSVTLSKCPELKKIFSHGLIQQLLQLKHLRVEECHQIEEIIMESENTQLEDQALPKLKTLILVDLPRLRSIWANDSLQWPSLQRVEISMCDMLKSLPFNKVNATKLRSIKGQQSWWGALVWKDDATKQRLQPLCILN
ncbi:Disease resistance protein RPS2 [Vitis vinifera]|uniref:Disease resistance protein RPS2 n=1 Tax=Vitis vinifera TaxID=29760 RepID=A0A438GNX4_VITVI|nr:Disease resistance protein RPS2 [Vitis vinifera]